MVASGPSPISLLCVVVPRNLFSGARSIALRMLRSLSVGRVVVVLTIN